MISASCHGFWILSSEYDPSSSSIPNPPYTVLSYLSVLVNSFTDNGKHCR